MKLVRLGALFGSVVLLVATSITMLDKRAERDNRQEARAAAAALVASESVRATIQRAGAVADLAAQAASTDDVSPEALIASFPSASACVIDGARESCSGAGLLAAASFEQAAGISAGSGGTAAAVADISNDSVMVVANGPLTVAIQLPAADLVSPEAEASINALDARPQARADSISIDSVSGPVTVDGSVTVSTVMAFEEGAGSVVVTALVPDDVGLFGDNALLYGALLGLGTMLIALAGWTFLAERKTLERRATTDELTGLVNRREFERLTEDALAEAARAERGVCMMLVDLNGFKQINDTLGHQFGDLVLQSCAERLTSAVRETDIVGRWGGDEFVILLPGIEDGTAVRTSAERIAARLSSTPVVGDVSISGSIGAALYPRHGDGLDELVRAADLAMYEAKTSGVNHRLADQLMIEAARETFSDSYRGPDRRHHPSSAKVDRPV